jgi:hypothetical protein
MKLPVGSQGSWFAKFDGIEFPCVHAHWYKPGHYHDPHVFPGTRQWDRYVERIRELGFVILTNDEVPEDPANGTFKRTGYIAIFEATDVALDGNDLRFRMPRRIEFRDWNSTTHGPSSG